MGRAAIIPDEFGLMARPAAGGLSFALGLAEAGDAIAFLPLTALLEQFDALKPLEHIAFPAQGGGGTKTTML